MAAKSPKLVNILGDTTAPSVVDAIKSAGVSLSLAGEAPVFFIKLPNVGGNGPGGAPECSLGELGAFLARIEAGSSGDRPLQVAADTAQRDAEGNLTFRTGNEARARTVTIPAPEVGAFVALLTMIGEKISAAVAANEAATDTDEPAAE